MKLLQFLKEHRAALAAFAVGVGVHPAVVSTFQLLLNYI